MLRTSPKLDLELLPLVLAGPILRRTEPQSVTVWVALKAACTVELRVMAADHPSLESSILFGTAQTVALGQSVHVAAITATIPLGTTLEKLNPEKFNPEKFNPEKFNPEKFNPEKFNPEKINITNSGLSPGILYAYDLTFIRQDSARETNARETNARETNARETYASETYGEPVALMQALRSTQFPHVSVSYFAHGFPTFALPPTDLNHLKIVHGSCRKVHDKGLDALPIIDQMIANAANYPNHRPHQLFLTGDQIYGDEVADPFLWGIQQLVPILFGWEEAVDKGAGKIFAEALKPGKRSAVAESDAGLTASLQGDSEKTSSHLLSFSEYCTTYLFSWSECLWHLEFPLSDQVGRSGKAAKRWDQEVRHLASTAQSQSSVRRALANIPTYMIFDDHDVSDDWNLNQEWCLRVLGKPLGRQVVRNALLAYSLFQGWGNTPEQFGPGTIGAKLLDATHRWCQRRGADQQAIHDLDQALGMPIVDPLTDLPQLQQDEETLILHRADQSLQWHYRVRGSAHEVLVLDTRTQRGYPLDAPPEAPPQLLSPTGFKDQLHQMLDANQQEVDQPKIQITFVVAPTNVFTLEILDWVQTLGQHQNKIFDMDIGDAWNLESTARPQLLQALFRDRAQVIVLSGDIHFGAALTLDYWETPQCSAKSFRTLTSPPQARLVQLIASALCNSEPITAILQTKLKCLFLERTRYWVGYPNQTIETEVTHHFWRDLWHRFKRMNRSRRNLFSTLPIHWGYRSHWLKRAAAQLPDWQEGPEWLQNSSAVTVYQPNLWQRLWCSRWWQEGPELIGLNNIGLVQLHWPDSASTEATEATEAIGATEASVIYDLYWYAPWAAPHIVYSRFQTALLPTPSKSFPARINYGDR